MERNTETWDAGGADLAALHRALTGRTDFSGVAPGDLQPMRAKGLIHAHVRIAGAGAILRIPRLSSFGFPPADNLEYQAACFSRAVESGHVPQLLGKIPPRDGVPWGALIVSEIEGGTPPVPGGMCAIARALAAIHALPVPASPDQPPLLLHDDPVAATLKVIEAQARFLDDAGLNPDARRQIDDELGRARRFAAESAGQAMPVTLVGTDTHPGNFLMQRDGKAVFVDLEKMLYGAPAIDLAHATVYTSTMWDTDVAASLENDAVSSFYDAYFDALPAALGDRIRPWCGPLRRFTWLRTTTWCAKWRVESRNGAAWSAAQHDPAYIAAVRRRVDDYFDPDTIARIRGDFDAGGSV
ncbi:MAG: aminoglycoside phosphotransferase family protein [Alphaproteobacteria bacterium]